MNNNMVLLCKKSYKLGGSYIYGEFKEGIYYRKYLLETDDWDTDNPVPFYYKYIYVYNENGKGGLRFHLRKDGKENYFPCFYDYFYDVKELRKEKLEKLNNFDDV